MGLGLAQITIDLDESVTGVLKQRATLNGTSLETEACKSIAQEISYSRKELLEDLERFNGEIRAKYGTLPDSTPCIREERDRRGY